MTDIPSRATAVPSRLGVSARYEDGALMLDLAPQPAVLNQGVVRASVVSFLVDAVAGITLDGDPEAWTFTTDMSIRMQAVPAPRRLTATNTILRQGRRSATCTVAVTSDDGTLVASGALGFVNVPRKATDPPKPIVTPQETPRLFRDQGGLARPLREEAGIEVIDAAAGVVQIEVTSDVCNPAGTLQGAMVALVAEAATEELMAAHLGAPVVVTALDLRYLTQANVGAVRTQCRLLGAGPGAPVEVELIDTSTGRITTHVYTHAVTV